ncbi:MAG: 30S ribosome-binding factor RbfA [Kiritimatiellaeota bacterium]|nr:30S ribosome-binding factor RbfA [Kiritimatiellota bacterium]
MPNKRMLRVNELLKREIADLLERMDVNHANCLISVCEVDVSPDLRRAKVHVSILGGDADFQEEVMKHLRRHRVEVQNKMARDIKLKYTPILEFTKDSRIEEGDRVLALLEEIERKNPPSATTDKQLTD